MFLALCLFLKIVGLSHIYFTHPFPGHADREMRQSKLSMKCIWKLFLKVLAGSRLIFEMLGTIPFNGNLTGSKKKTRIRWDIKFTGLDGDHFSQILSKSQHWPTKFWDMTRFIKWSDFAHWMPAKNPWRTRPPFSIRKLVNMVKCTNLKLYDRRNYSCQPVINLYGMYIPHCIIVVYSRHGRPISLNSMSPIRQFKKQFKIV